MPSNRVSPPLPNLVLTFLLEYREEFLLVRRSPTEANFPDHWAFPGGKVELNETAIDTIIREVDEETGLPLDGRCILLDAYAFGNSTGLAFLLPVQEKDLNPSGHTGFSEYQWVQKLADLQRLKRIPGIDNHLVAAQRALRSCAWRQLEELQLKPDQYLNP